MLDLDQQNEVIKAIVSSDGGLALAAERLTKSLETKVTEYELVDLLTNDQTISDSVGKRLRSLLTVRLFDVITQLQLSVLSNMDNMKPADQARTYAMFITTFGHMTAPAVKDVFDIDMEAEKAALEFNVNKEEIKKELKVMINGART